MFILENSYDYSTSDSMQAIKVLARRYFCSIDYLICIFAIQDNYIATISKWVKEQNQGKECPRQRKT